MTNIVQTIFFSLFFVLISRIYPILDFGHYLIANSLYSMVVGFSNLGLGNWFIREFVDKQFTTELFLNFFRIQLFSGVIFYGINVGLTFLLYSNSLVHQLSFVIGLNIVIDNVFYVFKTVNIAQLKQKSTFFILAFEAFSKCVIILIPYIVKGVSIFEICLYVLLSRLMLLGWLFNNAEFKIISEKIFNKINLNLKELYELILKNWPFVIISSIAIINWRIGAIIVSKYLSIADVANYEISFKLLSIAYLIPIIFMQSAYPMLIQDYQKGVLYLRKSYQRIFYIVIFYGFFMYSLVYSFSDSIIPFIFGDQYFDTPYYSKWMFIVILYFPSIYLQANVMLVLHLEKLDMFFNIINVVITTTLCLIFVGIFHSLSFIIFSIIISFITFHILQDIILIKNKIVDVGHVILFHLSTVFFFLNYNYFSSQIGQTLYFILCWLFIFFIIISVFIFKPKFLG